MDQKLKNISLIGEETKAIRFFLLLFYITFIGYELFYFYFFQSYNEGKYFVEKGLGLWDYPIIFSFLVFAVLLIKKGKPHLVKYLYFFGYSIVEVINNILTYRDIPNEFHSGNLVESLFILFAPMFINKKYFLVVTMGTITKYLMYGLIFTSTTVVLPIVIYLVFTGVSYALLTRFNSYIKALKEMLEGLHRQERLAVIGQMATAIGHEIRNPLSSLKGFTQLQMEKHPEDKEYYPIMLSEIDRINSIVTDLLVLGKPKTKTIYKQMNIKEILEYVVSITKQMALNKEVNIYIMDKQKGSKEVYCDENQLKQVFLNLIKNSIEAMESGGDINISIESEGNNILVSIVDQGSGILEEDMGNLGNPFFTTKKHGTGLGLLVSNKILEEHGGKMEIDSKAGEGTKVKVILSRDN